MFNVQCNVTKVVFDVDNREGHMYLPKNNVPDMRDTIRSFTDVDPEILTIYVHPTEATPFCYTRNGRFKWEILYP